MPFQSEKQRRFLHANHPEIAKRWERDYGEGGIAALNAQLNQLPEYYLPAAQGGRIGFHRGSTRHQLTHDYKAYAKPSDYLKWAPPSLQISPEVWNPERDVMQTTMKERFMYGKPTQEKEAGSTSKMDQAINAWIKSLFIKEKKNGEDFIDIDRTPGDYAKKREWWEDIPEEEKGPWDQPQKPWWEDDAEFNLVKGGIANHFKKRVKLQDSVESLSDTEFQTMYPDWDPNQFTREEYLQLLSENEGNGVLDLNPDDQPIEFASTEENEIIPDLLAPGSAAGILRLKDGGNIRLQPHTATDLLVKKNPDGTRSKYQPPGHVDAPAPSSRGPRDDPDRFGPPVTQPVRHHAVDTPAQIEEQRVIDRDKLARIVDEDNALVGWHPDAETKADDFRTETVIKVLKRKDLTKDEKKRQLQYQWEQAKKAHKTMKDLKSAMAISPIVGILAGLFMLGKAKKEQDAEIAKLEKQIGLLEDWDLDARHHAIDTPLQILEQRILNLTQPSTRDDTGGPDGPPLTIDVLAETKEEVEGAPDMISMMDRIRAGQAKRAMLVDKGIIQENPIVDESVTDITMTANRGGLANLFRVKNQ